MRRDNLSAGGVGAGLDGRWTVPGDRRPNLGAKSEGPWQTVRTLCGMWRRKGARDFFKSKGLKRRVCRSPAALVCRRPRRPSTVKVSLGRPNVHSVSTLYSPRSPPLACAQPHRFTGFAGPSRSRPLPLAPSSLVMSVAFGGRAPSAFALKGCGSLVAGA